jgi:hypothetical protein
MQPPQGPRPGSLAHTGTVMVSTYRATTHDGFITPKVIRKQKVIRASSTEYCVMSLAPAGAALILRSIQIPG